MCPSSDVFEAPPGGFRFGPVHPGRTLADELKARDLTAHALALKLRVPANRITELIQGKRGISAETALRRAAISGRERPFGSLSKANTIWKRRSANWAQRSRRRSKKLREAACLVSTPIGGPSRSIEEAAADQMSQLGVS